MLRLAPDVVEQMCDYWISSRDYFEGNPVAPPVIQRPVVECMDDYIAPAILQKFDVFNKKFEEHDLILKEINYKIGVSRLRKFIDVLYIH